MAGGALVVGAFVGYRFDVPQRVIAVIMAFGGGVAIAVGALSTASRNRS